MTENGNNCPTSEQTGRRSGTIRARHFRARPLAALWIQSHSLASVREFTISRVTTTRITSYSQDSSGLLLRNDKNRSIVPRLLTARRSTQSPELCRQFQGTVEMTTTHGVRTTRRETANTSEETRPLKTASIITVHTSRTRERSFA